MENKWWGRIDNELERNKKRFSMQRLLWVTNNLDAHFKASNVKIAFDYVWVLIERNRTTDTKELHHKQQPSNEN